jgi:hypothetical protein
MLITNLLQTNLDRLLDVVTLNVPLFDRESRITPGQPPETFFPAVGSFATTRKLSEGPRWTQASCSRFVETQRSCGLSPLLAATLGALITSWMTFVPSFMFSFVGAPYIERMRDNTRLTMALSAITAVARFCEAYLHGHWQYVPQFFRIAKRPIHNRECTPLRRLIN